MEVTWRSSAGEEGEFVGGGVGSWWSLAKGEVEGCSLIWIGSVSDQREK